MPIYMDRHDVSAEVTAEQVAQLHQEDLKIQHLYGCKGITYWFDGKRNTAFCLIEAPNAHAIKRMHDDAHGELPNQIIEVDTHIVASFLGRITDPDKAKDTQLNIIDDPAFRLILVLRIVDGQGLPPLDKCFGASKDLYKNLASLVDGKGGRIIKKTPTYCMASFTTVTQAIKCALKIQSKIPTQLPENIHVKMGISSGVPVTPNKELFEEAVALAENMASLDRQGIIVSHEVKMLYETESINKKLDASIGVLNPGDEKFLTTFIETVSTVWQQPDIQVKEFAKTLGISTAQLYRKSKAVLGIPVNQFIRRHRLQMALKLLAQKKGNISDVAFESGFSSPSYFSRCFSDTFGVLPSTYVQQQP